MAEPLEPLILPKKFKVPDGSQLNPGFFSNPAEATIRTAMGIGEGAIKLGYDTFSAGLNIGAAVHGLDGEEEVFGTNNFWEAYNANDQYLEYGDPQRGSGIQKGVANITPFILSTKAAATKFMQWGKAATVIKNAESFKTMLAVQGAAGIYADMIHTRKEDSSLFQVLDDVGLISDDNFKSDLAQWFINKDDDSEFEGRFKHAIEGGVLGLGVDLGFRSAGYLLDTMKSQFHKVDASIYEKVLKADEMFDGSGEFVDAYMNRSSLKGALRDDKAYTQFIKTFNSTPEDEALFANMRMKRFRGFSTKKLKNRQQKKMDKYVRQLDEANDHKFVPTAEHVNAGSLRQATKDYTPRQVMDEIPLRDTLRDGIDEKVARDIDNTVSEIVSNQRYARDKALSILNSPDVTPERKAIAKKFLGEDDESLLRLNPATSGDEAIKGAVRLMNQITGNSSLPTRGVRPNAELIYDSYENLVSGRTAAETSENAKQLHKFADEMGYDFDSVARVMSIYASMGKNLEEVQTAARSFRHEAAKEIVDLSKQIRKLKNPEPKLIAKYMRMVSKIDSLDSSLQGTIGTQGRLLNMQKMNPSEFAKSNVEWRYQHQIDKNIAKSALDEGDTAAGRVMKNLTDSLKEGNMELTKKIMASIEDHWTDPKKLAQKMKDPKFIELYESFLYGSYLSGIRTLTSSVFISNTVSTFIKSNLDPHFQAVIGFLMKAVGKNSTSLLDGFRANYYTYKQLAKYVTNLVAGDNRKTLENLFHLHSSAREGTEHAVKHLPEIRAEYKRLAEHYGKNDMYTKQAMINLATPMMANLTAVGNVFVRGIVNLDNFFRGINNEVHLNLSANRAWRKEGGRNIFGSMMDEGQFVKEYTSLQTKYANISRDLKATAKEKAAAFDKAFNGNVELFKSIKQSVEHAEKIGKEATFQQDPEGLLSEAVETLRRKADGHTTGKLAQLALFPFTRTPMNILDESIKYSPASVLMTRSRQILRHGTNDERIEVLSKMIAGTSMMYSVGTLVASDRIQGTIHPNDREAFKAAGIQEHSFKIGDTWYGYGSLGPIAVLLSTASDYWGYRYSDPDASISLLFSQSLALASDQSLYKTLQELLDLAQLEGPQGEFKAEKFAINKVSRLIQPLAGLTESGATMLELLVKGKQPRYRTLVEKEIGNAFATHKFILAEALKGNSAFRLGMETLGLAEYEHDLDVLGGEQIRHGRSASNKLFHLLGVTNQDQSTSPGRMELLEKGVISQTANNHTVQGLHGPVTISANQYKNLQQELHEGDIDMGGELDRLVGTQFYRGLSLGQQEQLLRRTIEHNESYLKNRLFSESKKLQRDDYLNGLKKVWRDTAVLNEPRNEEERYDDVVRKRALLRESNKTSLEDLKELLDTDTRTNTESSVRAAREALKPILGEDK